MNTKTTFTPAQIQKLATAFRTTCNTDWRIRTNSVTAVQAFRIVMSAFPGLLRDWNGFYKRSQRAGTTSFIRNKKNTRSTRTTKVRSTRKVRRGTKRKTRTGTKIKRSFGIRKSTRFIKGFKRTTKRFNSRRAA